MSTVNFPYSLIQGRLGIYNKNYDGPYKNPANLKNQQSRLEYHGGDFQQDRMIADKRRSLERALWASYQGAYVKLINAPKDEEPKRALINPDKLKQNYDDKIISIEFDANFKSGDVFEWVNTNSYWLIYLQELSELAYFRAEIRRCDYQIEWEDEDKNRYSTYAAIRGPVETKIDYIQKHQISIDNPNYSLNILLPKNADTLKQFKRYSKFYLQDIGEDEDQICWRVEAIDTISMPGIIELTAVEYYVNGTEDDIEKGIVGANITKVKNPNAEIVEELIKGETFIKPKIVYQYEYTGETEEEWAIDKKYPIVFSVNPNNKKQLKLKWSESYSGQFVIKYGDYEKTIVVESLY